MHPLGPVLKTDKYKLKLKNPLITFGMEFCSSDASTQSWNKKAGI